VDVESKLKVGTTFKIQMNSECVVSRDTGSPGMTSKPDDRKNYVFASKRNEASDLTINLAEAADMSEEEGSLSDSSSSCGADNNYLSYKDNSSKFLMTSFSTSHRKLLKGFSVSSMNPSSSLMMSKKLSEASRIFKGESNLSIL